MNSDNILSRIEDLAHKAAATGDMHLFETCRAALLGDQRAIAHCERRISDMDASLARLTNGEK